jgi:hypothetical protein
VVAENQLGTRHVRTPQVWLRAWLIGGSLSLLACAHLGTASKGHAQSSPSEYQVKAGYLLNFLKFVAWPEDAYTHPLSPIDGGPRPGTADRRDSELRHLWTV